jgi:hypothetical protein
MSRILTPEQVAEMLHCSADTVREKTPHIIPGAKFGRDWVYSEDLVVTLPPVRGGVKPAWIPLAPRLSKNPTLSH